MAGEKEILKYELDLTDVEGKAARLQELIGQIKKGKAAGADTSELEQQFGKEAESLGKLSGKQKEAGSATEDLLRKKHGLAAAVSLVGGEFGGLINRLGSVIQMFLSGNLVIAGMAAAMAGLSIGIGVLRSLEEGAKKAAEAMQRYNDAVAAAQQAKLPVAQAMAEKLEQFGARSATNIQASMEMEKRLRLVYGAKPEAAAAIAPVAVAAGMSSEDAARLRVLAGGGTKIETPEQARKALQAARDVGQYDALLATAEQQARDVAGRAVSAQARVEPAPSAERSPERAVYEALKGAPGGFEARGLPKELTFEAFQDLAKLRTRRAEAEAKQGTGLMRPSRIGPEWREYEKLVEEESKYGWVSGAVAQEAAAQAGAVAIAAAARTPEGGAPGVPIVTAEIERRTKEEEKAKQEAEKRTHAPAAQWPPESSAAAEAAAGDFVGPPAELAGGGAPTTAPAAVVHYHGDTINIGTQFAAADRRHSGRGLRPKIGSGELDERVPQ